MDDSLEQPSYQPHPPKVSFEDNDNENEELSSGDEDEGPDWTKLPTVSRPVIPKRGDKDFEPNADGGSNFQKHVLDRSRNAMLEALRTERNTSSKSISYGIWYPSLARTHVTTARGIHFTNMGHSVARSTSLPSENDTAKVPKRLELLPEEALYLVERGSMFCWKESEGHLGLPGMEGEPMSVQQTFAEMIGTEDLTLEKYQVYAYLKRLGYVVMRTKPPTSAYPAAAPFDKKVPPKQSILAKLFSRIHSVLLGLGRMIFHSKFDWWRPLKHSPLFRFNMNYSSVFRSLRFLPGGHGAPLHVKPIQDSSSSPYEIFYNIYKPSTNLKKSSPPAPDFSVVVVNARTTPVPNLVELTNLFDVLPDLPPPVPRQRLAFAEQKKLAQATASSTPATTSTVTPPSEISTSGPPPKNLSIFNKLFSWILPSSSAQSSPVTRQGRPSQQQRRPNPFAVLKSGKKLVVIAAVDASNISFFAFRQGLFEEFPMV
ncbi:tRNA-splicing endonuclease subunit sen54 N-term-domain-containing protein [Abortiporus biennis]|nr:tRNA-splicing endonuclease subunit sen54 N-term-domain-containing protein [Abortiporus biennis]